MTSRFTSPRAARPRPGRLRTLSDRQVAALRFLGAGPESAPFAGEMTRCIAYMCPWAYACDAAASVPSAVDQRACHRFRGEPNRPDSSLSDHSVDVLADHRKSGYALGDPTRALLDDARPNGPSSNLKSRRPRYPVRPT
ncbi:MAG: hypothetical protein HOC77_02375 [Chloroflexi bacterium]|nr:hypothetical protein [Chloroflexota bacterium]MBT4072273.1 hypothetical protein [Chloroflexota bacterium]MBT4513921.1 hypothetical protein [Chloroflexota bacterium]MBT5318912.1 hypothetical protein [Chloroflexota bacterium]MBT6680583.1 hypothetical protein [Chloroflexota bacterium]